MNPTFSLYSTSTGVFTGRTMSGGDADWQAAHTPDGQALWPGEHDHRRVRVDVATAQLVAYQPPAPADTADATWTWDATAWSWQPQPTLAAGKRMRLAQVQAAIDAAEASQARPLREIAAALATSTTPPTAATTRLAEIDTEIQALRAVRTAIEAAATQAALDAITWPN